MRCTLTIDGEKDLVSEYLHLLEYRESMDELDSLVVQIRVPRSESSALMKRLKPGIPYKLELGDRTAEGDIVRVSARRSAHVGLQVTLFGLEPLHRLRNQRLSEMKEQTRDAVAKTLLGAVKVANNVLGVKPTAAELVFIDDDQLRILKQLCVERNFAVFWSGGKVQFAPRNVPAGSAAATLIWGYDVLEASLDADVTPIVTKVTMHGRDYRKPDEALSFTADKAKLKSIATGDSGVDLRTKAMGDLELIVPMPLSMGTASAIEETAIGTLQRRAERFIQGKMRCTWHPEIEPSAKVEVTDAEFPFQGPFLVSAVTHAMSTHDAYSTHIEFFSDAYPSES
jgi:hypothetical protein